MNARLKIEKNEGYLKDQPIIVFETIELKRLTSYTNAF